jgi:23S rRNA pseudouridine1911/1915/1917 synthase
MGIAAEALAGPADAGKRLDKFLADAAPALSRMRLKALILEGCVRVGGRTITDPSYRVKAGEAAAWDEPAPLDATPAAQAIPLDVLHEDAHLIVIDKPAGLVVHPAPGNPEGTLVNALLAHCGASLQGIGGERRPGIVHRLDKDTSGLMVAAKTELAHRRLSEAFAARDIERAYDALVWGAPRPPAGEIEGAIGRDPRNRKRMAVVGHGGKAALTRYRTRRAFGEAAALLECRLATGRTHQIRVHLAARGHPVLGDPIYGRASAARLARLPAAAREAVRAFPRQALHARLLGFVHPVTGAPLRFEREAPADFTRLLEILNSG